jgi:hypothetical protein
MPRQGNHMNPVIMARERLSAQSSPDKGWSLEQINLMMTLYLYRHCEERSDVAIQTASWIATSLRSSQ